MIQNDDRLSTVHACLNHRHRRRVLHCLQDTEQPQTLADLAEYVAGQETDSAGSSVDADTVRDIRVELYHSHVPKLTDAGLVEYDRDEDAVALAENPEELANERPLLAD